MTLIIIYHLNTKSDQRWWQPHTVTIKNNKILIETTDKRQLTIMHNIFSSSYSAASSFNNSQKREECQMNGKHKFAYKIKAQILQNPFRSAKHLFSFNNIK